MRILPAALAIAALAFPRIGSPHDAPGSHAAMSMTLPPVQIQMTADSVIIPMRLVDGRIIVAVTVNGKGPFPFVFDTGAHGSVMDLSFARQQGLELGAEIMVGSPGGAGRPGHLVTIDHAGIGGLTLGRLTSVAFDGMPFKGADPPRGVLGPYGLSGLLITLDYPNARLVFARGALPAPDGREIFGWDDAQSLPSVPVMVAGQAARMHLDSGAAYGLSFPIALAQSLPLATPLAVVGRARTVDLDVVVKGAPLKGTVTIGRYTLENPPVVFSEVQKEIGNVGPPVLRQFALTIDPANRRLRLSGPPSGKLTTFEAHPHPQP
jgi:hypothetical protein